MITEIVRFRIPETMSPDEVVERFRQTAAKWRDNPDLIRKNYLLDVEAGVAGGVYLWPDVATARKWHDAAWCKMVEEVYGNPPEFRYFDTPIVVDNAAAEIVDERAAE